MVNKSDNVPWLTLIAIYALAAVILVLPLPTGGHLSWWVQSTSMLLLALFLFWLVPGLVVLRRHEEAVVVRWGKVVKVLRTQGWHFVSSLGLQLLYVSTAQQSMRLPVVQTRDRDGVPVEISATLAYHVVDAQKAALDVQDVPAYVEDHAVGMLRRAAAAFPFESAPPCLRETSILVTTLFVRELGVVVAPAGVEIDSVVWSCTQPLPLPAEA